VTLAVVALGDTPSILRTSARRVGACVGWKVGTRVGCSVGRSENHRERGGRQEPMLHRLRLNVRDRLTGGCPGGQCGGRTGGRLRGCRRNAWGSRESHQLGYQPSGHPLSADIYMRHCWPYLRVGAVVGRAVGAGEGPTVGAVGNRVGAYIRWVNNIRVQGSGCNDVVYSDSCTAWQTRQKGNLCMVTDA
jgi:hypothetical protein